MKMGGNEEIYYKLTKPDGTSFHDGRTKYRVGHTTRKRKCENPEICSKDVLHASKDLVDAIKYAKIPFAIHRVAGVPVAEEADISGFFSLKVIETIPESEYDDLLGFRYHEFVNPIDPFDVPAPDITDEIISLVREWDSVRRLVWNSVKDSVIYSVWNSVIVSLWDPACDSVWDLIRNSVKVSVWDSVWNSVKDSVWNSVKDSVWDSVWAYIGSLFLHIETWKYVKPDEWNKGKYPFESGAKLWKMGLIPVFYDGKWHLCHPVRNEKAILVWEGTSDELTGSE